MLLINVKHNQATTPFPTSNPSNQPTQSPSTAVPTSSPSKQPTQSPSTDVPTSSPWKQPTSSPNKQPTQSPSTAVPTSSPSNKPTASPSKKPTSSPVTSPDLPGTCSNDMVTPCSTTTQCNCGVSGGDQQSQSANLFGRHGLRKLQDPCSGRKNKECNGSCTWQNGRCVSNTTNSPTANVRYFIFDQLDLS